MFKFPLLALVFILSIGGALQADNNQVSQVNYEIGDEAVNDTLLSDNDIKDIENLDPNSIPGLLPSEASSPLYFKLRLLKEYLYLQMQLAKQHVVNHKKIYILTGLIIALSACKIISVCSNNQR
jgi:hypothetical protein